MQSSVQSRTTTPPLLLSQLGKRLCLAAGSSWDVPLSTRRTATVLTAWMPDLITSEDWPALWAMVRAECDVAPVHSTTCRTAQNRNSHAFVRERHLLDQVKKDGALAAARNAPPVPQSQSKSLCPTDPEPPAPAQAFVSNLFLSEVAELIPTTLRKMP